MPTLKFSKRDFEISRGKAELFACADADIQKAYGEEVPQHVLCKRTLELYSDIVEVVEIERDVFYDGLAREDHP